MIWSFGRHSTSCVNKPWQDRGWGLRPWLMLSLTVFPDSCTLNSSQYTIYTHPISSLFPLSLSSCSCFSSLLQSKELILALFMGEWGEEDDCPEVLVVPSWGDRFSELCSETPACHLLHALLGVWGQEVARDSSSWQCLHWIWDLRFHFYYSCRIFLWKSITYRMVRGSIYAFEISRNACLGSAAPSGLWALQFPAGIYCCLYFWKSISPRTGRGGGSTIVLLKDCVVLGTHCIKMNHKIIVPSVPSVLGAYRIGRGKVQCLTF